MGYRTLRACIADLEASGRLVRIEEEIDAELEAAEIHRRVHAAGGPAIFFARVKGCRFPMVSNLFGTLERSRYMFRDALDDVRRFVDIKVNSGAIWRSPWQALKSGYRALNAIPKRCRRGPILDHTTTVDQLPQLKSWPEDGGPFITLPLVYTEDPDWPGWRGGNLGMYRIQLGGNQYRVNSEVGLHYQIHRGIGVHHAAAVRRGEPLRVNVFVGGAPAMALAAVMPLPEGMPELAFAGILARHRIPLIEQPDAPPLYAEADFCLSGVVRPGRMLPEGPFGDHLGYYSLRHDFPVLEIDQVWHRRDAVWPFTVVGRPPQEDTSFGQLIHELTGPILPTIIPGLKTIHAVDAAGVHPLLLAIGSERYTPYSERNSPQEILTIANAILGQGQLSLAKYLFIVAGEDDPKLDSHDVEEFFRHVLQRVDWRRDLHFQTRTTIDTLDYSGTGLNSGSKLVVAATGRPCRELARDIGEWSLPDGFTLPRICLPGVIAISGPRYSVAPSAQRAVAIVSDAADATRAPLETPADIARLCEAIAKSPGDGVPLIVVVDDSAFTAQSLENFLWVTFTRSNPASDVHGVGSFVEQKHWGCRGPLVIDARIKPHHAPPLVADPAVSRRVDALAARGGPLHGII